MENSIEVPQKLRLEPPYDPAIHLLAIYPQNLKTLICKGICTPMYITALVTTAKTYKQPMCPLTDD